MEPGIFVESKSRRSGGYDIAILRALASQTKKMRVRHRSLGHKRAPQVCPAPAVFTCISYCPTRSNVPICRQPGHLRLMADPSDVCPFTPPNACNIIGKIPVLFYSKIFRQPLTAPPHTVSALSTLCPKSCPLTALITYRYRFAEDKSYRPRREQSLALTVHAPYCPR